jgi:enoyl-CoA hydratase/carnithine racemase
LSAPLEHTGEALSWSLGEGGLLEVVLHRAPLNEIGEQTVAELEALVPALSHEDVRGLLVHSRLERGFSAGADLRALHEAFASQGQETAMPQVRAFVERIHAALCALDEAPLPTVAAVHGVCFGGGLELALCCDLIVADRSARFAFPELRLGIVPGFGGLPRLLRDVGNARVRDLLLTGRSLGAEAAQRAGLVSQVTGAGKHVAAARRLLGQIVKHDPLALAAGKAFVKPSPREALRAEVEIFCELIGRPQAAQALASFVARADGDDPLPYLSR